MTSTDILRHEHELIEHVLDGLDEVARRLEAGRTVPLLLLDAAADFLGAFVDGCHQAKEDEVLFPRLARLSPPTSGPVVPLESEHREATGRLDALRAVVRRGTDVAKGELARALREYVAFLRAHFEREDTMLFPLIDRLSPEVDERIAEGFAGVDGRTMGHDARAALLELGEAVIRACRADLDSTPASRGTIATDVMRAVPRLAPDQSVASAAQLMESLHVRELPVVAHGRLVGLLAYRDLRPHEGHWEWTTVETAMTPDPVTVTPDTPVGAVADLLLARGFNAVPVTVGSVPLGMITRADLLRVVARSI